MKKYIIIGLSLLFVLGTTSCEDWLDLRPENDIVLEDFWKTKYDVESVLATCYRSFTERSVIESMITWGELRSDNFTFGRTFSGSMYDMYRILIGDLNSQNSYTNWGSFYSIINYCNTLLYYAPGVVSLDENFTPQELNFLQGEARTLRALAYFYLVRTFRDIPLVIDPSVDDTQDYDVFQNKEEEVLSFIINELEEIRQNNWIRQAYGDNEYDKGRITLNAVNALLADVYLWNEDYANCIRICDEVLADENLTLVLGDLMYSRIYYQKNSTESIFELQFNDQDMKNTAIGDLYGSQQTETGYLVLPPALGYDERSEYTGAYSPFNFRVQSVYESKNDLRSWQSVRYSGSDIFIPFKYIGSTVLKVTTGSISQPSYNYSSRTPNWIIYRLSEVMLMKAEAIVQMDGNWEDAFELVSTVYMRSNAGNESLNPDNYPTKKEREELVLRERQRELMFEGKRWFDLVRMARRQKSVSALNQFLEAKRETATAPLGAVVMDALYMPIQKTELETNPNLVQNPFYEESEATERD